MPKTLFHVKKVADVPASSAQAYARAFNADMGRMKYRNLEKLIFLWGADFAFRVDQGWKTEWSNARGDTFKIKKVNELPPEMLIWGIGIMCCAWGADIYLRKARDRRRPQMAEKYHCWRRLLLESLTYIEREVGSHKAEKKYREWLAFVRRAQTDPTYNPKTNRFDRKVKRHVRKPIHK